ncbi:hypothetical protein BH11PSE12_BH11PSE12_25710 [soil metagenome]
MGHILVKNLQTSPIYLFALNGLVVAVVILNGHLFLSVYAKSVSIETDKN